MNSRHRAEPRYVQIGRQISERSMAERLDSLIGWGCSIGLLVVVLLG